jgi:precorrin-6Y C5,15-methyltransferase (decarboxylating)
MLPLIHIIGLGVTETEQFSADALDALSQAALVIGSERQLEIVQPILEKQNTIVLPKLNQLKSVIEDSATEQVVILASGDPLYYGIGRWFSKQFPAEQLRYYPAVSSIQAACHSIGLSLQDAKVISLHGRPVLTLRRYLAQQNYLVILTLYM